MSWCAQCGTILVSEQTKVCDSCLLGTLHLGKVGTTKLVPKQTLEAEPPFSKAFSESLRTMQHAVHENAKAHGWWDEPPEDGTVLMLIVRELSELVEELRVGGRESATIDGFTSEEEELADAVLRILDFAGRKGYRLGQAILAKHAFNLTRPHKHGGKLF